jgi:hypothetical protein
MRGLTPGQPSGGHARGEVELEGKVTAHQTDFTYTSITVPDDKWEAADRALATSSPVPPGLAQYQGGYRAHDRLALTTTRRPACRAGG